MVCEQGVPPARWQERTACKVKIRWLPFAATVQAVLVLVFVLAGCEQAERRSCSLWALEAQALLRCICLLAGRWSRCILRQFPASPRVRESLVESHCILGLPVPVVHVAHAPRQHGGARIQRTVFLHLASSCVLALHAAGPGRTGE